MRDAGKLSAAIEILADFETRRVPVKVCLQDWARGARYAGSKDRAWISGLVLDALRARNSYTHHMGEETARAIILATCRYGWEWSLARLDEVLAEQPHGAGAMTTTEQAALSRSLTTTGMLSVDGNFPDWLEASVQRAFADAQTEMQAFTQRASVDLRVNTLKTDPEKALKAVSSIRAETSPLIATGLRVRVGSSVEKAPPVETIPAFSKGWVEVQDIGSQLVSLAAGEIKSKQVLDLCAGGGGKTLALAAMMGNSGQLFSWDIEARRLAPLFDRAKRAGQRNGQIISPADGSLEGLVGKMDVVFIDAPCSGTGTWRRHPDTKWRITEAQLQERISQQDTVLSEATKYVKPGGRIVYVTCSFLVEENEDRLDSFLSIHTEYQPIDVLSEMKKTGLLTEQGEIALSKCAAKSGSLRLSPLRTDTDAFFVSVLQRKA